MSGGGGGALTLTEQPMPRGKPRGAPEALTTGYPSNTGLPLGKAASHHHIPLSKTRMGSSFLLEPRQELVYSCVDKGLC